MTAFSAWASEGGQIVNAAYPPIAKIQTATLLNGVLRPASALLETPNRRMLDPCK